MPVRTKTAQLTTTEAAVLGLLSHGPRSGYDLKKDVESSVGYFWGPAKSQIYAVLPQLVEAGLASAKKVAQAQRPVKSVYRLTAAGRDALKAWIEETPPPPDPDRNPLLLKVFFGEVASRDVLVEHIRERRREAERLRTTLQELEAESHADDLHGALTRRWGLEYAAAVIRWAKHAERELRGRSLVLLSVTTAALVAASPAGAALEKQRPLKLRETCVTRAERAHIVRFRAGDRVRLIGVELGTGPRVVILAHQGGSNLCSWVSYARTLVASGYRVLVFDHRGFGSSGRASHWRRQNRVDYDVIGAIRAMRARGATSIVLGGGSLGGAAVLSAAALVAPPVDGVISFASPSSFGFIDAFAAVAAFRVPALFLAAELDGEFPDVARELYERCASPDKQLAIFPGGRHGAPILRDPQARATVDDFIARQLQ